MALPFLALLILAPVQGPKNDPELSRYRFDYQRVFYPSNEAEQKDTQQLKELTNRLAQLKGKVASSPQNLLQTLRLLDERSLVAAKLYIHRRIRYMVDTRDSESRRRWTTDDDPKGVATEASAEVGRLTEKQVEDFVRREPALARYRFAIEKERRTQKHRLPEPQEQLLADLRPHVTGWQYPFYEDLLQRDRTKSPDLGLRFFVLDRLFSSMHTVARARGHRSAIDSTLQNLYLTRSQVDAILDRVAGHRKWANELDRVIRLAPKVDPPKFPISEGMAAVRESVRGLGPTYLKEFEELTDPANGRIDIAGGPSRSSLGTGWGFPGSQTSVLYWPEYTGTLDDMMRGLAHEGGHAIHFNLMGRHGVLPVYSDGPNYFTESFAMLNQLLLSDSLYRREKDPALKSYYLTAFLKEARFPLTAAFHTSLEYGLHEMSASGRANSPADFNLVEQNRIRRLMTDGTKLDADRPYWATTSHYASVPLYQVNYLVASLLALKYFELYESRRDWFVPRYIQMVRNGFDAPPNAILQRFLAFGLDDPELVDGSLKLLQQRLPELEQLNKQR